MKPLGATDPTKIASYRILAELGRGGMGRVLLGCAPDGRLVALKLIRPEFAEDNAFRERFRAEVAASRKVSGTYTAAVIDDDVDAPLPWLASVFVLGPSLANAVAAAGVLPEDAVLHLAAGLGTALVEIHSAGLVHRDLKPSNVLLAGDGVRVIDFGIARAVEGELASGLTHTGWLVGTPPFMSPEQAEGQPVTPVSDVFSLGSVLVMACTGKSPFSGPSAPQTLYRIVHTEPDLSSLPTRVREIVLPCLAKKPEDRPSPDELVSLVGELPETAQPWPAEVHRLVERQQAEVLSLAEQTEVTVRVGSAEPTVQATRQYTRGPFQGPPPARPRVEPVPVRPPSTNAGAWTGGIVLVAVLALIAVLVFVRIPDDSANASGQGDDTTITTTTDPPYTTTDTTTTDPTTTEPTTTTTEFDPTTLDSSATDQTPLTSDAMLPQSFTDDRNISYSLVASGVHPCVQNGTSDNVRQELTNANCTSAMTGSYLESGSQTTANNDVLVSVQVIPFADAATAEEVYNSFPTNGSWSFGVWCPTSGVGAHPCDDSTDFANAQWHQYIRQDHRYLIEALAVYTDLTQDSGVQPWLVSAANKASDEAGPENYAGNN